MDALEEELLAVQAIFPECISRDSVHPRRLTLRPLVDTASDVMSITLAMPREYPEQPPSLLSQHGIERSHILQILQDAWTPGEVCLYMLVDNLRDKFDGINPQDHGKSHPTSPKVDSIPDIIISSDSDEDGEFEFFTSAPIVDRKSTFLGRAIKVNSRDEAKAALAWLKSHNKKTAKATHNIVAWRIVENGILMQDNDDDGEDAAGTRLAHLLDIMDLKNVMVIVSRWYGGVMLHGDRFKHISNVGREALEVGGFFPKHTSEPGKSGSKKKSRKRK